MVKSIFDGVKSLGERIQEIRNGIGGADYVQEWNAAKATMQDGKPLEALAHKIKGIQAAGKNYEQESPLSRLKRVQNRIGTEPQHRS